MMYYRGKIVKYDMIGYGAILLGFLILLLLGFATSSSEEGNWGNMVLYILLYFIFCPIIYKVSKCFQCKYLRQAHFVLSVICRAENNRYYLKRGVEVRPGYLAKWIEFSVIDTTNGKSALEIIQNRHKANAEETKKNVEADHLRYMENFTQDFDTQAVNLRVQVEKALHGRDISAEERANIVNIQREMKRERLAKEGVVDNGQDFQQPRARPATSGPPEENLSSANSFDSSDLEFNDLEGKIDYVEEQRRALAQFTVKIDDAAGKLMQGTVAGQSAKKAKKKKKKRGNGQQYDDEASQNNAPDQGSMLDDGSAAGGINKA